MILKLNPSGKSISGGWRPRLIVVAIFSAVLTLLAFFAFAPLLYNMPVEQEIILKPCSAITSQQIETSTDYQSEYGLSTMFLSPESNIQPMSDTRPSVTISLEGTLGADGWYTSNVEASFYVTGGDPASLTIEYAFYNQGWKTFVEPLIIFEEGQTAIYYRARDATGFVWETTVSTVDIDKTPPKGSVLIERGAKEAFSIMVNLTLSVTDEPSGPTTPPPSGYIWGVPSGPSDMRFSNDGVLWSSWEPLTSSKSWILETGAGNKTVYVQARDNAGIVSEIFSDTINLITTGDSIPPVTRIDINGKQNSLGVYTSNTVIVLSATDDLSGVSLIEYSFDDQTWTEYIAPVPFYTEGETTIYFRSHDANGNIEPKNLQTIEIRKIEDPNSFLPLATGIAALVGAIALAIVLVRRKRNRQNQKFDEFTETQNARESAV